MTKWDDFIQAVEQGAAAAALDALQGFKAEASADAKAFVIQTKTDFETWTAQVGAGTLSPEDMTDYVQADIALAKMAAITQAGIAAEDVERLRDDLVKIIVDAAFSTFRP